ncbi:MAG: SIMPL domain-containing protein [Patescibacteria group bacterium]
MEEKTLRIIPQPPILKMFVVFVGFLILLALYFKFIGPIPVSLTSTITTKTDVFTSTGEGKAVATPDIAKITLGITVNQPQVKLAQDQANKTINKIQEDIKKLGISEKDIKTTRYDLNPTYDWREGKQRITGYEITINLEVKVRDFDKINSVIDTATADGANLVGSLQFSLDDPKLKEVQNKAREEAVKVAKEKAQSLARASGIRLGKILNAQENIISPWEPRPIALEKTVGAEETPTQIIPGEQEIRISVTLTYETR